MFYERKEYEIITGAEDIQGNCLSFVVADDEGMLSDFGHVYGGALMNDVENRWNKKIISDIIIAYGCKLRDNHIVRTIYGENIEGAIMAMIQAVTAAETYLYLTAKTGMQETNETNKATMIQLAKIPQNQVKELIKQKKLLYRSLAEIKDVNDAIMSDTDDEFKAVDVSYLNGFIDAKMSAIDAVVGERYKGDSDDR